MQGPKKMAGGGIIAFANEGAVPPAKEEEATSALGDMARDILIGPEKDGKNAREIEWEAVKANPNTWFNLATAMTPSQRAAASERAAALRREAADIRGVPVDNPKKEVAQAEGNKKQPDIQKAPDSLNGLAALMQGMGGGRGGGGLSKEDNELRQRILKGEPMGPAQTAYMQNVDRLAPQLESSKPPVLSDAEASAIEDRQFGKYQARSKPHFDMMQKLIDEERRSTEESKPGEVYKMLGKMGSALMSSRGAFGPALGHAVGEGIDYNDKVEAARAAAERLRRQAQMDLVKARMADEKDDQKSAQAYVAEHDRKIRDAYKIEQEGKIAAMTMRGKAAEFEAGDERGRERAITALALSDAKRAADSARLAGTQENNMLRLQLGLMGLQQKREVAPLEKLKIKAAINEMFSGPALFKDADAIQYISALPGNQGVNLLAKIKSGELNPKDAMESPLIMQAKQAAYNDFLAGTSKSGGGSGVQSYDSYVANLPK
jgi:hypothetical protein